MELNGLPVTQAEIAALGLVGYGHFTSMRVEAGGVRGLTLHLDRLTKDCREVFAADLDPDRVRDLVRRAIGETIYPVIVRVTVFDPALELGKPGADAKPQVLITMRPAPAVPQTPVTLQSAVYRRDLARVKHVGLFGPLHHRAQAQRAGFDDVLFTEPDGTISEIATSNIAFITRDGQLIWPDADVLPGVTMRLLGQARDEEVLTEKVTLSQLDQFVGAVATNAAVGVRAVARIDETYWPIEHELVEKLRSEHDSIPPQRI